MKKIKIAAIFLFAVLSLCTLAACSRGNGSTKSGSITKVSEKSSTEEKLLGSWYNSSGRQITFYNDSTCDVAGDWGLGSWRLTDENHIEIWDFYWQEEFSGTVEVTTTSFTFTGDDGTTQFTLEKPEDEQTFSGGEDAYELKLLGSWSSDGRESFMLFSDGTCEGISDYGLGTWAVVNGNLIKFVDFYGEVIFVGTIDNIDANTLEVTSTDGQTHIEYTRTSGDEQVSEKMLTKNDYSDKLLGTWSNYITFYSNGTCDIEGEYGVGSWAVVNGNILKYSDFYGQPLFIGYIEKLDDSTLSAVSRDGETRIDFTKTGEVSKDETSQRAAGEFGSIPMQSFSPKIEF